MIARTNEKNGHDRQSNCRQQSPDDESRYPNRIVELFITSDYLQDLIVSGPDNLPMPLTTDPHHFHRKLVRTSRSRQPKVYHCYYSWYSCICCHHGNKGRCRIEMRLCFEYYGCWCLFHPPAYNVSDKCDNPNPWAKLYPNRLLLLHTPCLCGIFHTYVRYQN